MLGAAMVAAKTGPKEATRKSEKEEMLVAANDRDLKTDEAPDAAELPTSSNLFERNPKRRLYNAETMAVLDDPIRAAKTCRSNSLRTNHTKNE
jgi:hypothetical protein